MSYPIQTAQTHSQRRALRHLSEAYDDMHAVSDPMAEMVTLVVLMGIGLFATIGGVIVVGYLIWSAFA